MHVLLGGVRRFMRRLARPATDGQTDRRIILQSTHSSAAAMVQQHATIHSCDTAVACVVMPLKLVDFVS